LGHLIVLLIDIINGCKLLNRNGTKGQGQKKRGCLKSN
jgi:hypothetical protein